MVKVAFILSNLDMDGGQTVVCTLIKNLDKSKYLPRLYILSTEVDNKLSKQLSEAGIEYKFLCKKFIPKKLRFFEIIYQLNKEIELFNPNVINVHLDTLYSWVWAFLKKKRIIFTVHSEAKRIANPMSLKLFDLLNRKELIRVVGVSKFASLNFEKIFSAKNVLTIYNPVDICCDYSKKKAPRNLNLQFINVARFNPVKNHKLLIDAFLTVCQELNNVQLVLVGDGQEYDFIKQYVIEKGIKDKVVFTGYRENVIEWLEQSDVFVLSSYSEAFPVSVIEAIEVGLPIIATEVGGLPEAVTDNGILVESNNENELANAMLLLAKDEDRRKLMGNRSLQKSELFSTTNIISQYGRLYDEEATK